MASFSVEDCIISTKMPLVDYSLDESYLPLADHTFDYESCLPLVDYTVSECGDDSRDCSNILEQTLENLQCHLAAMKTPGRSDVCRLRRRVQLNEHVKHEQRRVSLILETEMDEEEERKVKVLRDVAKTTKRCSRTLDTDAFRRFSPRRTTLKGTTKSRPLKKKLAALKPGKMTARRQSAFSYLLMSERLCFKTME